MAEVPRAKLMQQVWQSMWPGLIVGAIGIAVMATLIVRTARRVVAEVRGSTIAISSRAIQRPTWLACATHWLPTAARLATTVKVSAMPSSSGSVLRRKGRSARANTNGSTGRMQGLSRVSAPPR